MRKKNVYNSIIGGILAAVMLLSFAGCGNSNLPVDSTDDISISTNSSEAESSSENVENVGYEFPAGAESEYALYTAVVDYLNNGFHADELKDVFDLNLTLTFYSKLRNDPKDIITLGMKYDEACTFIARLRKVAENMDYPEDDDDLDYDAFFSEFPEDVLSRIDPEDLKGSAMQNFLYMILDQDELRAEGENPYGTDQTVWVKVSEDEFENYEYDDYKDFDEDLLLNFPHMYGIDLGTYVYEDETFYMSILYTEIDGRYYCIGFSCVVY